MWISKARLKDLERRIVELEKNQIVTFGVPMYTVGEEAYRPGADMDSVVGKPVRINELVCAIANYLGFKYRKADAGGIQAPKPVITGVPDPLKQAATGRGQRRV